MTDVSNGHGMPDNPLLDGPPPVNAHGLSSANPSGAAASDDARPTLPDPVLRHLGHLIAAACTQSDDAQTIATRFGDLLARLAATLGTTRAEHDAEFQAGLLRIAPNLRRFALSLAHEPAAADDLVQDTLLRAWRSRASFTMGTNLEAWAFTILRNAFFTERRKAREVQDEDGTHAARLMILPEQPGRLDLADVRAALARMTPPMREALVLVGVENLSYEEAAAVMGCAIGTVKSRVWRARDQLARALGYTGDESAHDGVLLSAIVQPT